MESSSRYQSGSGSLIAVIVLGVVIIAAGFLVASLNKPQDLRTQASAPAEYLIFGDALAPGWVDWSWDAKNDFTLTNPVYAGQRAVGFTNTKRWGGLYLHTNNPLTFDENATIMFALQAKTSNTQYGVRLQTVDDKQIGTEVYLAKVGGNPKPGVWQLYIIPLTKFGLATKHVGGIIIQDESGTGGQTVFVDEIKLTTSSGQVTPYPSVFPSSTPNATASLPPSATPTSTTTPQPTPTGSVGASKYPWHTNIVSTTFWVGEIFDPNLPDGSQVCSTYDSQWAYHWSGVNKGTVPNNAAGCPGSIVGGCDGVAETNSCATERRTATNNYFPTQITPKENPFYLDIPYDDLNDATAFKERCQVIPWANQPGYTGHCTDQNFSYMKNRWLRIIGPNGHICYGQVEDAGPSHGSLYHDKNYVFGTTDAQPVQGQFNNAGMDVSPALNGCLGFSDLDGQNDKIRWQFVDDTDVPTGPWKQIITTRQVTP